MNELMELKNLLQENQELDRTEKIILMMETLAETLPLPVQMLVKTNFSLVTHYIEEIEDDELNLCLDTLADILHDIRGC